MLNKIKEYITYRKNKKIAKRELAKVVATTLPVIREFAEHKAYTLDFIKNTALAAKNMDGSELVNMVVDAVAEMFAVDHERFIEVGSYLVSLSPEEIQKILMHSMVETIPDNKN